MIQQDWLSNLTKQTHTKKQRIVNTATFCFTALSSCIFSRWILLGIVYVLIAYRWATAINRPSLRLATVWGVTWQFDPKTAALFLKEAGLPDMDFQVWICNSLEDNKWWNKKKLKNTVSLIVKLIDWGQPLNTWRPTGKYLGSGVKAAQLISC